MGLEAFSGQVEVVPLTKFGTNSVGTPAFPICSWDFAGSGGAGTYPGSASAALDANTVGSLLPPFGAPQLVVGANCVPALSDAVVVLVDRLVHTAPITTATGDPITLNTVPLPARAADGTDVMIALERTTTTSLSSPTDITFGYTDGDDATASFTIPTNKGWSGRAAMIITPPTPVKSIETIQFSPAPSSVSLSVVLIRPIFAVITNAKLDQRHQPKGALGLMPAQIPPDACLSAYVIPQSGTSADLVPNLSMTLELTT